MAITQISQITTRQGLQENLPVLSGGEFGWSYDQRRLFIGNGPNSPIPGNTEILTEISNIMEMLGVYTYQGTDYGYTVSTGNPTVSRSLQEKLDDLTNGRDFAILPNGQDMSTNFNFAITQCYEISLMNNNPEIRRVIDLAPGWYVLNSDFIRILPYVRIRGAGKNNTFIVQMNPNLPTAVLTDAKGQFGGNIGTNNSMVMPGWIAIEGLTLINYGSGDVLQFDSATKSDFKSVGFKGNTQVQQTGTSNGSCINFFASVAPNESMKFFDCDFGGKSFGISANVAVDNVLIDASDFDNLYQGVNLSVMYTTDTITKTTTITSSAPQGSYISASINGIGGVAIKQDGSLWGWGDNSYSGEPLSTGTFEHITGTIASSTPVYTSTYSNGSVLTTNVYLSPTEISSNSTIVINEGVMISTTGTINDYNNISYQNTVVLSSTGEAFIAGAFAGCGVADTNFVTSILYSPDSVHIKYYPISHLPTNVFDFGFMTYIDSNSDLVTTKFSRDYMTGITNPNNAQTEKFAVVLDSTNKWKQVSVGNGFFAGVTTTNELWGMIQYGNTNFAPEFVAGNVRMTKPVQIGTSSNWKSVSCGDQAIVAVDLTGNVWGLGTLSNANGYYVSPLGTGNASAVLTTLTQIPGISNVSTVSIGESLAIAIKNDGTAWYTGDLLQLAYSISPYHSNVYAQLGNSTSWVSASVGPTGAALLDSYNNVWTLGQNSGTSNGPNGLLGLGFLDTVNISPEAIPYPINGMQQTGTNTWVISNTFTSTSSTITTSAGNLNTISGNAYGTNFKIIASTFDNIYAEGITTEHAIGGVQNVVSAFNTFKNVGNNLGTTGVTPVVNFTGNNSYSVDFFSRSINDPVSPVNLNNTLSFAILPNGKMLIGQQLNVGGFNNIILDNSSGNVGLLSFDNVSPLTINYSILRGIDTRYGTLKILPNFGNIVYEEDYFETNDIGITLTPILQGNLINVNYQSTLSGNSASFTISSSSLSLGNSNMTNKTSAVLPNGYQPITPFLNT